MAPAIRVGARVRIADLSNRRGVVTHLFGGEPPHRPAAAIVVLDEFEIRYCAPIECVRLEP